jgi:hypothetical protein
MKESQGVPGAGRVLAGIVFWVMYMVMVVIGAGTAFGEGDALNGWFMVLLAAASPLLLIQAISGSSDDG